MGNLNRKPIGRDSNKDRGNVDYPKACPLCGSQISRLQYALTYGDANLCLGCGVTYTRFYDRNTFFQTNLEWGSANRIKARLYGLPEYRREAKRRLNLLLEFHPGPKLIEFGSNTGEFLYVAARAGFQVTGVDQCPALFSLNKVEGLRYIRSEATAVHIQEKYDVAIAFHLLEHLEDPALFLCQLQEVLRPHGLLFLEVPNYGSRSRMRQGSSWRLFFDYHITHFNPESLTHLIESAGFRLLYSRTVQPTHYWIDPLYLPFRDRVWTIIRRVTGQPENTASSFGGTIKTDVTKDDSLSLEEETAIYKSFKARLFRLETRIKMALALPLWPFAQWIASRGQGDLLQIIATPDGTLNSSRISKPLKPVNEAVQNGLS